MCGIVGVFNHPEAATLAYLGLYALQHRGQESAGIVTADEGKIYAHRSMGLVADIFKQEELDRLKGNAAIGHVRYSTHGGSQVINSQPFIINYARGALAVAHNGNIVNADEIRADLEKKGAIFQSTMDTEVIVHLIARSKKKTAKERLIETLNHLQGAFSLTFLTETKLIVARDPSGFRPLVLGKKGTAWIVASETCALDLIGASFEREVAPGEVIEISAEGMESYRFADEKIKRSHCIFEHIYFARPDSQVDQRNVYDMRKRFGQALAKESSVDADVVFPVPDSGVPAAIGYAQESGLPFELGLVRNHYVGRTFIEPEQRIRHFGVKVKLNPVRSALKDKRVVLVDDSIVRGTTSQKIIKMIRDAGAKEVHMRISSPPTKWPCFYGIDTPRRQELISAQKSVDEICEFIQADSLKYLSVDALYHFDKLNKDEFFCDACFTGNYPVGQKIVEKRIKEKAIEV